MTMPKWHEIMRPVLEKLAADGGYVGSKELTAMLVEHFEMTDEERSERLASGQLRLSNRMGWAVVDLEKAGFLSYGEKRGTYCITEAGRSFLAEHDEPLTAELLFEVSPSFAAWKTAYKNKAKEGGSKGADTAKGEAASPQETMEAAAQELRDALADKVLQAVVSRDPFFFEHLVGELLEAMGYGAGPGGEVVVTQKSGDEGVDGLVKEDRLGFESIYYQAKRWDLDSTVGRPAIQSFVGALSGKGANKGLFITTAKFSASAREYAKNLHEPRIVLVDGPALAGLMIDHGVGVSTVATYEVKALDSDFFSDEE